MSIGPRRDARAGMSFGRKAGLGLALAGALVLLAPSVAGAQDVDPAEAVTALGQQINLLWIVIGAVLVIFMQAGLRPGRDRLLPCQARRPRGVDELRHLRPRVRRLLPRRLRLHVRRLQLRAAGLRLRLRPAPSATPLIGSGNWVFLWQGGFALSGDAIGTAGGAAVIGFFLYMVAFMDTVATIPTGAMAERWKWKAFVGWGLFCGAIYYPLFGAWTWGGGWLAKTWDTMGLGAGYVDFAGSGVVHAVGGVAGLAGAIVLGPRIGKFNKDGTPNTLPGHHIPMAMLGCFILLFGWFGFNAASTLRRHRRAVRRRSPPTPPSPAAFGAVTCDVRDDAEDRQARSRDDGQRHARRPGGHHGAVRLHQPGVVGASSASSPACSSSTPSASSRTS